MILDEITTSERFKKHWSTDTSVFSVVNIPVAALSTMVLELMKIPSPIDSAVSIVTALRVMLNEFWFVVNWSVIRGSVDPSIIE